MKKAIQNQAMQYVNNLANIGIFASYRTVLDMMYDSASEREQYEKAHIILELINDDIED